MYDLIDGATQLSSEQQVSLNLIMWKLFRNWDLAEDLQISSEQNVLRQRKAGVAISVFSYHIYISVFVYC